MHLRIIVLLLLIISSTLVLSIDNQMQDNFQGDNQLMKPPIGDLQFGHLFQGIIRILNFFDEELFAIIYFVALLFFFKKTDFVDKEKVNIEEE